MKYILILFTCVSFGQFNPIFYNSAKPYKTPGNTDLVAYYGLNNSPNDETSLSPNGSVSSVDYVTGKTGNAARFAFTNSVITIADSNNFSFTTGSADMPFSITFWVYFTGFSSGSNRLISKRDPAATNFEWQIYANASTLGIQKASGGDITNYKATAISTTLSTSSWYHVAITSDGTNEKIYLNGVLMSGPSAITGTYANMINTSSSVYVGNLPGIANAHHQGYMEDISFWKNRTLTLSEINYIRNLKTYPF